MCPSCGYDMGGLQLGPCPECGREFTEADQEEVTFRAIKLERSKKRREWQIVALVVMSLAWCAAPLADDDYERVGFAVLCCVVAIGLFLALADGFWLVKREHRAEYRAMWCDMAWMIATPAAWAVVLVWTMRLPFADFVIPILFIAGVWAVIAPFVVVAFVLGRPLRTPYTLPLRFAPVFVINLSSFVAFGLGYLWAVAVLYTAVPMAIFEL